MYTVCVALHSAFMRFLLSTVVLMAICGCASGSAARVRELEIRGVWIATVANLDWPSKPDRTTTEQQDELLRIFDRAAEVGLNAVFLQVRPSADAIYPSTNAPWTEYLSGASGRAPDPPYDPLAFAVAEAHKRGLAL